MTRIPEAVLTARRDGRGRCDVEDQRNSATMQIPSHIAQLARHNKAEHSPTIVRIVACGIVVDRLEPHNLRQDGIVALESRCVRTTTNLSISCAGGSNPHRSLLNPTSQTDHHS